MKKASLVVSRPYQENKIFDAYNKSLNRDNCLAPFLHLKKELASEGFELSTNDIHDIEDAELIIYNDMPKTLPAESAHEKSYLLILESPLIVKNSWDPVRLNCFRKVFSWNDEVIDNKKFFKINYSFEIPNRIKVSGERTKLCCLISANKRSEEENELYTERIKTIRWFENNAIEEFDLYGIGWSLPPKNNFLMKVLHHLLKKLPLLRYLYAGSSYPSYKGVVNSKKEVLENYDFSICYENIKDLRGYITEKIFDSFFAGCIPIYWGAQNILDYIPGNCFIDRRNYNSIEELYGHISSLSSFERQEYRENISNFLKSERISPFDSKQFAKTITREVLN